MGSNAVLCLVLRSGNVVVAVVIIVVVLSFMHTIQSQRECCGIVPMRKTDSQLK